ncbi:PadR family transcriptional regulator [Paenibacillus psychroresistens]|uniref:PadR family transcriptional regulator n=1 Tax=Paenibacillus psychroresistens TaxID=1778678 RepID=UPI001D03EF0D
MLSFKLHFITPWRTIELAAILVLLNQGPHYGYEIKKEFDEMVQAQWPLNTGQIYSTIDRLVRDELVDSLGKDDADRKQYAITSKGEDELRSWLLKPVERSMFQDEFYFKVLCARKMNFVDEQEMITRQRGLIMQNIMALTKLRRQLYEQKNRNMLLMIEGSLLHLEADLKWLEIIDSEK